MTYHQATDRPIAMSPSGSISWHAHEMNSGTLYMPGNDPTTDGLAANLLLSGELGTCIGRGNGGGGIVCETPGNIYPDIVIKEFRPDEWGMRTGHTGSLGSLRANVMLACGLDIVEQQNTPWRIRGAKILGALVLKNECWRSHQFPLCARWLLERVRMVEQVQTNWFMPELSRHWVLQDSVRGQRVGTKEQAYRKAAWLHFPLPSARRRLYDTALAAANGSPLPNMELEYDDNGDNLLIEALPNFRGQKILAPGSAVKIDIRAYVGLDF